MKFVISLNNTCHHEFHHEMRMSQFSYFSPICTFRSTGVEADEFLCRKKTRHADAPKLPFHSNWLDRAHCSFIFNDNDDECQRISRKLSRVGLAAGDDEKSISIMISGRVRKGQKLGTN